MLLVHQTVLCILIFVSATAIPIDNGLVGEPLIECGLDGININCQTRNAFLGHVYVKGYYSDNLCRTDSVQTNNQAIIRVRLDTCGVRRLRSVNPPGLYQSVTVVVTFHPFFITKVDRAINIQCFYMESNKFVTQQIDVSMLSTESRVVNVPLPICRYEVLNFEQSFGPYLAPVRFARVGQPVLHKWQCETETINVFCITVHSCQVDDGLGNTVRLLDENGCAMDRYLLGNLEYPEDLTSQKEAHVFKYADKTQVYFQCQVTLSYKPDQQNCPRPSCGDLTRGKRSNDNNTTKLDPIKIAGTLDVSKVFTVIDVDPDDRQKMEKNDGYFGESNQLFARSSCISPVTFTVSMISSILLISTSCIILSRVKVTRKKNIG